MDIAALEALSTEGVWEPPLTAFVVDGTTSSSSRDVLVGMRMTFSSDLSMKDLSKPSV